jgi:hypothetical protein
LTEPLRRRRDSARRRPQAWRWLLLVALGTLLFVLGVGLGLALEENPEPGGSQTAVRTLDPLPLVPARETVTVTVTAP